MASTRTGLLVATLGLVLTVGACSQDDDESPTAEPEAPTVDAPDQPEPPDPGPDEPDGPDLDVDLRLTEVAEMEAPTAGAVGPDGRLYLAERAGTLHPLGEDGIESAVLDLSELTTTDGERGLLGVAFAPDGSELYASYTDLDGATIVEAVAIEDEQVVADERRTVFTLDQPYRNHNGGDLAIGPDGLLFLALGDGGGAGDPEEAGQDLSNPLGSLLRLDPLAAEPYGIPDDNPFLDDEDAAGEIYAYGLRNPWRFSFDPPSGTLWIADVGQDEREEINVVDLPADAGANFGWSLMEGTREFAGPEPEDHLPPVHEYETSRERCAITGGHVYRGSAIPELVGAYLFSDYCEGTLRAIVVEDGEVADEAELDVGGESVVAFAQDAAGEIHVLDLNGEVWRLEPGAEAN